MAAVAAAHEEGARVTAHCFGEESVATLVRAGIDGIEHGTGLDDETIAAMAERIVGEIRLPRTLGAWAAGALLGLAGFGLASAACCGTSASSGCDGPEST